MCVRGIGLVSKGAIIYLCVRDIGFASKGAIIYLCFRNIDFASDWSVFGWILELIRQCDIC